MYFKSKRTRCKYRTVSAMTPMEVAACYNFPQNVDVSKQTVCILELGGAYNPNDVVSYCNRYNLKQPQLFNVMVDGAMEVTDPQGADGEVCLDLDVILATAQGIRIVVVFAPNSNQGFIDGVKKCIELAPDAISISWGMPEALWDSTSMTTMDELFKEYIASGGNVFVASGDNASSDGIAGTNTDYPASSPYVVGCGGTHLELDANGNRALETCWNLASDGSGGGGGISTYPKPTYQNGINISNNRMVPDISGNADPNTGYIVDIDGSLVQVGGTSAVAPLMAALCCILNAQTGQKVNWLNVLYANPDICYDITSGGNGAYKAGPGYDCITGLGVPDAARFLDVLNKQPVPNWPPQQQPPGAPVKQSLWQKFLQLLGIA